MHYRRWLAAILLLAMLIAPGAQAKEEIRYTIEVDLANQLVTVYHNGKDRGEENVVRQMICSSGTGSSTPTGTFTMPKFRYFKERTEWYYFGNFDIYAKYASRIVDGILFHSILYNSKHSGPTWGSVNALGSKASHGCIRLRAAANLDCNALAAIYNAEPMQVFSESPVWSKVRYQNFVGWVSSKYIEIVRDANAA